MSNALLSSRLQNIASMQRGRPSLLATMCRGLLAQVPPRFCCADASTSQMRESILHICTIRYIIMAWLEWPGFASSAEPGCRFQAQSLLGQCMLEGWFAPAGGASQQLWPVSSAGMHGWWCVKLYKVHVCVLQGKLPDYNEPVVLPQNACDGGGLLQSHPQNHYEAVQVCAGVGHIRQAPTAEGWTGSCAH